MFELINPSVGIIQILITLFITALISAVDHWLYREYVPKLARAHQHPWKYSFFKSLHEPFQVYLWVISANIIFPIVMGLIGQLTFLHHLKNSISLIPQLLTILILFWFVMRFIRNIEHCIVTWGKGLSSKREHDETNVHAAAQIARIALIVITTLLILQAGGVKISALLALGGVGGLALSFAAKDTVANFIGGMMIYWDRPFSVGDWIRSPDREIEGTVEHIGWRLTRIRTFDLRPLYLPNGIFSTIAVENPSRMSHRRIKMVVGVRYSDLSKITLMTEAIKSMLLKHPEIDPQQTCYVNLSELAASSLNITVCGFTRRTDTVEFQIVQQDVLLKIMDIIIAHGAECAYPSHTLYYAENQTQDLKKLKRNLRELPLT